MRMRPLLVSAACSGIAALALVISEGALLGMHVPGAGSGGGASAPQARSGGGAANGGQGSAGTFDTGEATPSPDSQTDQQSTDQMPSGNDQQSQAGPGGIDPGGLAQLLPVPTPITIGR